MSSFLLVFDINDTLLTKIKPDDRQRLSKLSNDQFNYLFKCKYSYLLERRYTDVFVEYLNKHNLDYIFWSTAKRHNIQKMIPFLKSVGYNKFLGFLSQEECEEGVMNGNIKTIFHKKNLKVAAEVFYKEIDKCVLIDNAIEKRVGNQNFIKVEEADPYGVDNGLLDLCKDIDNFINCQYDCFAKRL